PRFRGALRDVVRGRAAVFVDLVRAGDENQAAAAHDGYEGSHYTRSIHGFLLWKVGSTVEVRFARAGERSARCARPSPDSPVTVSPHRSAATAARAQRMPGQSVRSSACDSHSSGAWPCVSFEPSAMFM